ncbi:glycine zipper domain-containing protein [Aureimonas sp. Leaf324]|jgi:hypothetical protein|uniref:glycine zipper domain-containing protein n=1 Tax=Aureimonas TaxID=414371 RepID=UPI000A940491|nr:glycine zipper domain-containing protein [Aureimonas sp. Leaf324]
MKSMILAAVAASTLALAGCQSVDSNVAVPAGIGALGGAAIGAGISGNARGALIGAAVGGAGGALLGAATNRPGQCVYRDGRGQRYYADCPAGY